MPLAPLLLALVLLPVLSPSGGGDPRSHRWLPRARFSPPQPAPPTAWLPVSLLADYALNLPDVWPVTMQQLIAVSGAARAALLGGAAPSLPGGSGSLLFRRRVPKVLVSCASYTY